MIPNQNLSPPKNFCYLMWRSQFTTKIVCSSKSVKERNEFFEYTLFVLANIAYGSKVEYFISIIVGFQLLLVEQLQLKNLITIKYNVLYDIKFQNDFFRKFSNKEDTRFVRAEKYLWYSNKLTLNPLLRDEIAHFVLCLQKWKRTRLKLLSKVNVDFL